MARYVRRADGRATLTSGSTLAAAHPRVAGTVGASGKRRLRVLFCLDSFHVGGSELNAIRTAERLDPERIELSVACLRTDGPLWQRYEALGVRREHFPLSSFAHPGTLTQAYRFARFVRRHRFDIVQSHDVYNNIFAIPAARAAGFPATVACRRWWTETPRRAHRVANRLAYRLADRVLVNSESIGSLVETEEGIARSRITVIPNFVDDEAFQAPDSAWRQQMRQKLGLRDDDLVIGSVANLHAIKNHELLIRAASRLAERWPMLRLVIVGDGERRELLHSLAVQLGIGDRVVFAGLLPQHPSPHYLFDTSVLTSRGEGFPNSIVEAMAAGRPIVATAVGGVVDAFTDNVSGRLVPSDDVHAVAAAVEFYLCNSEARRAAGLAARREAEERYHARRILPLVHQLYEDLASDRARDR